VSVPGADGWQGRNKPLYIFGAGGAGREVAWLANELGHSEIEFLVDRPDFVLPGKTVFPVTLISDGVRAGASFVVALGDSRLRERAVTLCIDAGLTPVNLVHPRAHVAPSARIGLGSIICSGAIISTDVEIGRHVYINIGCTVSHDVSVADYCTLSPGTRLSGHVHVERHVFFGTGAVVINGEQGNRLTLGEGAVVAASACITSSVQSGALMAGVPALKKR
jgi:sugar O-acyltransferase (sialic acid O-acetyltransferase NeuD family)